MSIKSVVARAGAVMTAAIMLCTATAANATTLTFSEPDFEYLSQDGGAPYFIWTAGDYWEQEFTNTGLDHAKELHLHLEVVENDVFENLGLDILVNGINVGSMTLLALTSGLYEGWFSFPSIPGDDYQIRMLATNTISPGAGAFSLVIGGPSTAHLVPEPGTLALLGVGLAGLGVMRRRKTV